MAATTTSLRAQHAMRTRLRIAEEAIDLFIEKGFDATTVDEIAERADVSPRTYFRYFPTKEAVLFHDLEDRLGAMIDRIGKRPADEPPAETLIQIMRDMSAEFDSGGSEGQLFRRLLSERPSLRSYQRTTIAEHCEGEVTAALARHAGLPVDDLGLQVAVATIGACFDIAARNWVLEHTSESFVEVFDDTLAACAAALPGTTPR